MRDLLVIKIKEEDDRLGFNFTTNGSPIEIMNGIYLLLRNMSKDIDVSFEEIMAMLKVIKEDDIDG